MPSDRQILFSTSGLRSTLPSFQADDLGWRRVHSERGAQSGGEFVGSLKWGVLLVLLVFSGWLGCVGWFCWFCWLVGWLVGCCFSFSLSDFLHWNFLLFAVLGSSNFESHPVLKNIVEITPFPWATDSAVLYRTQKWRLMDRNIASMYLGNS